MLQCSHRRDTLGVGQSRKQGNPRSPPAPPSFVAPTSLIPTADHIHVPMDAQNGDPCTHTRKILFLTNAESGQANTILALALEALTRPHVQVHAASFPTLKRRVERLSPVLNFHVLDGVDMLESRMVQGFTEDRTPHPPTRKSFAPYGWPLPLLVTGWDGKCAFCSFL